MNSESVHRSILDQMYDGVYFVDTEMAIRYWNQGAERISGFTAHEVLGTRCMDSILTHVDDKGTNLCLNGCPLSAAMRDGHPREAEIYLHHKNGHRIPVLVRTAPLRDDDGRTIGGIEVFSDNRTRSAMRDEIEKLTKLALVDPLTEAGNRRYGEMTLRSRHSELERYGWPYGVLMIDIDHFKSFNDRFGHDTGDRVLRMVAQTLLANVRSFDAVARWGGEEFVVILEKVDADELAARAAGLCRLVAASNLTIEETVHAVTVSIGATTALADERVEDVLVRADVLLYRSKAEGRNRATYG